MTDKIDDGKKSILNLWSLLLNKASEDILGAGTGNYFSILLIPQQIFLRPLESLHLSRQSGLSILNRFLIFLIIRASQSVIALGNVINPSLGTMSQNLTIGHGMQSNYNCSRPKTTNPFYGRNFRMFVISWSVCPRQAFLAYSTV